MNLKNKYQKCNKITELKFRQILRLFALDLTASNTAKRNGYIPDTLRRVGLISRTG